MRLTVLNVAFPLARVGPDAVGGAEQVLSRLDQALELAGHRSIVVASEGSQVAGLLVPTPRWTGPFNAAIKQQVARTHRHAIELALARYDVDLIHFHGIDFFEYLPGSGPPALVTLHLPADWYPPRIFNLPRPNTFLHCVSESQRQACPAGARLLPTIPNGVSESFLSTRHAKRPFALCLGRICPEKGFHLALDAARMVGCPLLIGGEVFPYAAHQEYFQQEIIPRLDGRRRMLGPVGLKRKLRLLTAARCLLVPSLVAETSSLVALESLACGTPVIAFPSGALPHIVEHGRTGWIVRNTQEMADAVSKAGWIDSAACRHAARTRFPLRRTTQAYLRVYQALATQSPVEALTQPDEPDNPIRQPLLAG